MVNVSLGDAASLLDQASITFSQLSPVVNTTVSLTTAANPTTGLTTHRLLVTDTSSSVVLRIVPLPWTVTVWYYFRAENPPTRAEYDYLDKEDVGEDKAVVNIVIGSDYVNETGTYYIGLYYDRNLNGKKLF